MIPKTPGAVEVWGRGTNRVIAMCRVAGLSPPTFEEITGAAVVTFNVNVLGPGREVGSKVESGVESKVESVGDLRSRVLAALQPGPLSKAQIAKAVGKKKIDGQLHAAVRDIVAQGLVEYTIPDKPRSRLQRYRTTAVGLAVLKAQGRTT